MGAPSVEGGGGPCRGPPFPPVLSRPARRTVRLIARRFAVEWQVVRKLRLFVVRHGETAWSGEEVAARSPADYERWCTAPHLLHLAAGETLGEVAVRVTAGVRELQEAHAGETIVLVSHAIVIRLIVLDALGLGHERLWTVDATPAGITEIEYEPGWATVHRMNTLAHLEAVER